MPRGPFDLVLCRNLAFTYFEEELQRRVLGRIAHRLAIGGALVLGAHETLPTGCTGFDRVKPRLPVWRASLDGDGASSDG